MYTPWQLLRVPCCRVVIGTAVSCVASRAVIDGGVHGALACAAKLAQHGLWLSANPLLTLQVLQYNKPTLNPAHAETLTLGL